MGSYNASNSDLYHTSGRANSNLWVRITADNRLLYVYNHVDLKLAIYFGERSTGTYARKGNISIPQTFCGRAGKWRGLDDLMHLWWPGWRNLPGRQAFEHRHI